MAVDYLLQEDGFRIELEDASGFLIIDITSEGPAWVVGLDRATSSVSGTDSMGAVVVGQDEVGVGVVGGDAGYVKVVGSDIAPDKVVDG